MQSTIAWYNQWRPELSKSVTYDSTLGPTSGFERFCTKNPYMPYLGRVNRTTFYKSPPAPCMDALDWIRENDPDCSLNYGYARPSCYTGYKGISGYNRKQPEQIDSQAFNLADSWTERHFVGSMGGSHVISLEASVLHMDRSTSTGYPWNLWYNNKGQMIDNLSSRQLLYPMLESFRDTIALEQPEIWSFWMVSQKYEMRALEKLRTTYIAPKLPLEELQSFEDEEFSSIRVFVASPFEHNVTMNCFCLDMNNRFYRAGARGDVDSFVGRSKYRGGFNILWVRFGRHRLGFSCDGSKFDQSLFVKLMWSIALMRWRFIHSRYKDDRSRTQFFNLYMMAIFCYLVLEYGELVLKLTGNPSGFVNTIVDNTLALFKLLCYAWIRLAKETFGEQMASWKSDVNTFNNMAIDDPQRHKLEQELVDERFSDRFGESAMRENVVLAVNGDDSAFTVSVEAISWFNCKNVARIMSELGVKFTGEEEPVLYTQIEFLSQRVVNYKGMYLPVPDRNKVLSSLVLCSKNPDPRWTLLRAFALRIESWADPWLRDHIMDFITFMLQKYHSKLVGNVHVPGTQDTIPWSTIQKSFLTDYELELLYCGLESRRDKQRAFDLNCASAKINLLQYCIDKDLDF